MFACAIKTCSGVLFDIHLPFCNESLPKSLVTCSLGVVKTLLVRDGRSWYANTVLLHSTLPPVLATSCIGSSELFWTSQRNACAYHSRRGPRGAHITHRTGPERMWVGWACLPMALVTTVDGWEMHSIYILTTALHVLHALSAPFY